MRHLDDEDLDIIGIYLSERILHRLDRIERTLRTLARTQGETLMDLTALTAEVSANTDVTASAATLLGTLAQELRDAAGDPAAVEAIVDSLEANNANLSAAVAANTPAAPDAPPADVPVPPADVPPPA